MFCIEKVGPEGRVLLNMLHCICLRAGKGRGGFDAVERGWWHLVYYAAERKAWDW